jgi:hypothetical protein
LVEGTPRERRTLLRLTLPALSDGAVLNQASLVLKLEANADSTRAARRLGLHQLDQPVGVDTTWRDYSNKKWITAGGDFGPELARATLPSFTSEAELGFEITDLVQASSSVAPVTLSIVILEIEPAPPAPAELAFTSLEGDASKAPVLRITYCEP